MTTSRQTVPTAPSTAAVRELGMIPNGPLRADSRIGSLLLGLAIMCLVTSCSSPRMYGVPSAASREATCSITFEREKGVIGNSGPSFLLADMGDDDSYNGTIIVDETVHPHAAYRQTGQHTPNVAYLGALDQKPEIMGSWVLVEPDGKVVFEINSRELAIRRSTGPVSKIHFVFSVSGVAIPVWSKRATLSDLGWPKDRTERILRDAQQAPEGTRLIVLCTATPGLIPVRQRYATSVQDAYSQEARPVRLIGRTGTGGKLTWTRPPGRMRLAVAAPYVGLAECMDEVTLESGGSYRVFFDHKAGSFRLAREP